MKEKIKKILSFLNNWKLIIIIFLIGAGLFYWFELRPTQIRKECYRNSFENRFDSNMIENFVRNKIGIYDIEEQKYKNCLKEHGLEK